MAKEVSRKIHKVSLAEKNTKVATITYGIHISLYGWCVIGVTTEGIIHLEFLATNKQSKAVASLKTKWDKAILVRNDQETKRYIKKIFSPGPSDPPLHLVLCGTDFQIKVWQALLAIPSGQTSSYSRIAQKIGAPRAARAIGSACGQNTIGYLVPCHKVLTSKGELGGYRWGTKRKKAMLARE